MKKITWKIIIAKVELTSKTPDIQKAIKALDASYLNHPEDWEDNIEEMYSSSLEALSDQHGGDCTCFAYTCSKCLTEEMFDVNTRPQGGKYVGYVIQCVFGDSDRTCAEALDLLKDLKSPFKGYRGYEGAKIALTKHLELLSQYGTETPVDASIFTDKK